MSFRKAAIDEESENSIQNKMTQLVTIGEIVDAVKKLWQRSVIGCHYDIDNEKKEICGYNATNFLAVMKSQIRNQAA